MMRTRCASGCYCRRCSYLNAVVLARPKRPVPRRPVKVRPPSAPRPLPARTRKLAPQALRVSSHMAAAIRSALAEGQSHSEISKHCGHSRTTVRSLDGRHEAQLLVSD